MPASNIHEYIKLRQHFINLTLHADPESPLPSERTLAETFGVARKTVRRALEDMVAGNYLIKRPRRGYFVNPLSMREDERRQKIIGLLFRNGMHALYNREDACFMEAFFREIRRHDACVQLIMTSGTEMIYSDIANSGLDGLVWLGVPPGHTAVFERIHREGLCRSSASSTACRRRAAITSTWILLPRDIRRRSFCWIAAAGRFFS